MGVLVMNAKLEARIGHLQSRMARLASLPQSANVRRKLAKAYRQTGDLRRMSLSYSATC